MQFNFYGANLWCKKGGIMKTITEKGVRVSVKKRGKYSYLRALIRFEGKTFEFYTGIPVDPAKWDNKKMQSKNGTKHTYQGELITDVEFDEEVKKCRVKLSQAFNRALIENEGIEPVYEKIKKYFKSDETPVNGSTNNSREFLYYYDQFVLQGESGRVNREAGKQPTPWSERTSAKYKNGKDHFAAYNSKLRLNQISLPVLYGFKNYLLNLKLNNTTIEKIIKTIRVYSKWLYENGHITQDVFKELKEFKMGLKRVSQRQQIMQNISLNYQELIKVYKLKLPIEKQYLIRVRDVFVFQCMTGLRYSDISQLRKSNFKPEKGKFGAIEFFSQKGEKTIIVPLTRIAKSILIKYKNYPGEELLPVISNQRYNDYLRKVGKEAGLNEWISYISYSGLKQIRAEGPKHDFLTTHTARKTFINCGFDLGLRPEIISAITGTSLQVILQHYRSLKEDDLFKAMEGFK